MLHTIEEDVQLCKEFKITPAQLFFVKMLVPDPSYKEADWRKKSWQLCLEYEKEIKGIGPDALADLVGRDIIVDHNDMGKTMFDYYEINPKFAGKFMLKVRPMAMDLQENYPPRFKGSDGKLYIGITASAEEIAKDYIRAIENDPEEHKRVMEDLEWAKKNNGIVLGLKKFVMTRYWRVIREARSTTTNKQSDVKIV